MYKYCCLKIDYFKLWYTFVIFKKFYYIVCLKWKELTPNRGKFLMKLYLKVAILYLLIKCYKKETMLELRFKSLPFNHMFLFITQLWWMPNKIFNIKINKKEIFLIKLFKIYLFEVALMLLFFNYNSINMYFKHQFSVIIV